MTQEEDEAIKKFLVLVTMPILIEQNDKLGIAGTGTLFKICGRVFLITAGHTIDEFPLEEWAFPEHPLKGDVHLLGLLEHVKPIQEHLDVAVVEIKNSLALQMLEANWSFLTLENVALPPKPGSDIFLCGYPKSIAYADPGRIKGRLLFVRSQELPEVPPNARLPIEKGVDLFVRLENATNDITGQPVHDLELHGASGCSIWIYRQEQPKPGLWSPQQALRVVAIQSSFVRNKYYRAKSWNVVANLLREVDPQIAEAMAPYMQRA